MQFHLNGFTPGDPEISTVSEDFTPRNDNEKLPGEVDVLIVGCGPAGLTLAAQLSVFPSIKTCIVEQKSAPMQLGQADGVACRSMEMFNAFGFADRLLKEAYWVNETTFWQPDTEQPENITRTGRVQDVEDGLSEFPHVILNQARVHDFYLEFMRNSPTRLEPAYSRQLLGLDMNSSDAGSAATASHPVTARFERVDDEHQGQVETMPDGQVVLGHFCTQNGASRSMQEGAKSQAGNNADQEAGQYQNRAGDQHAARRLVWLAGQVLGDGAKKHLCDKAQGVGHAEGARNYGHHGQSIFPGVAIAGQNGLGKEHFFGDETIQ